MTTLSIIVPTITGREDSLQRTLEAYQATTTVPHQIIIVPNETTWPAACNVGARIATGEVLHFTADDLEPVPGWHDEALAWLDQRDELVAGLIHNHTADGPIDNAGDGDHAAIIGGFTRVPLMTRSQHQRIGEWPEYQYVADVWVSDRGRSIGIPTRMCHTYRFIHHWSQIGRTDDQATLAHAANVLAELRAAM